MVKDKNSKKLVMVKVSHLEDGSICYDVGSIVILFKLYFDLYFWNHVCQIIKSNKLGDFELYDDSFFENLTFEAISFCAYISMLKEKNNRILPISEIIISSLINFYKPNATRFTKIFVNLSADEAIQLFKKDIIIYLQKFCNLPSNTINNKNYDQLLSWIINAVWMTAWDAIYGATGLINWEEGRGRQILEKKIEIDDQYEITNEVPYKVLFDFLSSFGFKEDFYAMVWEETAKRIASGKILENVIWE